MQSDVKPDDSQTAASTGSVRALYARVGVLSQQVAELVSHIYCPNEKVQRFVQNCSATSGGAACSQDSIKEVIAAMTSFDHVMFYYRKGVHAEELVPQRRAKLQSLIQNHQWTINTRLMIVTLPFDKKQEEAQRLGDEVHKYIRQDVLPKMRPDEPLPRLIGPTYLGCSSRREILSRYEQISGNKPFSGEPGAKEERTVVWAFLIDCHKPEQTK
jgi:hypothetical protein